MYTFTNFKSPPALCTINNAKKAKATERASSRRIFPNHFFRLVQNLLRIAFTNSLYDEAKGERTGERRE